MIQKNVVYRKSAKGIEAIATRQHGLSPKQRSALILIDGKRGFDELGRLSQMLGDTEQLLGQLLDEGFIEEASSAAGPAPRVGAPHIPMPTAAPAMTLTEAQRFAVKKLLNILGPTAETLCLRIEATRNAQDFQAAVARAEGVVRDLRGVNIAAEFAAEMQPRKPSR